MTGDSVALRCILMATLFASFAFKLFAYWKQLMFDCYISIPTSGLVSKLKCLLDGLRDTVLLLGVTPYFEDCEATIYVPPC